MKHLKSFLRRMFHKPTLSEELRYLERCLGYEEDAFLKDRIWTSNK